MWSHSSLRLGIIGAVASALLASATPLANIEPPQDPLPSNPSSGAYPSLPIDPTSDFVTVQNLTFYRSGKPYYLVSMNYWSAMNLAASEEWGGNLTRFEEEVGQMAAAGVNNVRIMAASEGSQFGIQPFRMYPPLMPEPGVYNEIFIGLDRSLATFKKYGITVVMTLNNFWHWSGGAGQYVSWVDGSQIPYPPSWDPTLNPPWGDYTTNGTWDAYIAYAARFYNDTKIAPIAQRHYQDHIQAVLNRVNTVTGVKYMDDPTIMTWELMNEPQLPEIAWVWNTAEYIKKSAPKQLVTPGSEGKDGWWWFETVHRSQSVDYATGHLWVQNRGYYNMTDPSEVSFQNAVGNGTQFLSDLSQWAMKIGKPVVLEEFGMARDNWENVAKGAPTSYYLYGASATTHNKDRFFQIIISSVVEYYKQGKAWAGTGPWAYGGIWRPTDRRNQYNELWAGDPPHEAPGWYDIYDKDQSTLAIITAQARNVSSYIASRG